MRTLRGTSKWLLAERKKRGLSQAKFAIVVGVDQHTLSACETGKRPLSTAQVENIELKINRFDKSLIEGEVKLYSRQLSREPNSLRHAKTIKTQKASVAENPVNFFAEADKKYADNKSYFSCTQKLRAVSLFAGCGGLCLGFKHAGFRVLGFVESVDKYRKTYTLNFPEPLCLGGDICQISDEELTKYAAMLQPVDVVFGGPPCQGFSLTGKRDARDERNTLFQE